MEVGQLARPLITKINPEKVDVYLVKKDKAYSRIYSVKLINTYLNWTDTLIFLNPYPKSMQQNQSQTDVSHKNCR